MSYKTILTYLNDTPGTNNRARVACTLANEFDAHLIGLAAAGVASLPGDVFFAQMGDLISKMQSELDSVASQATAAFESICQAQGVASVEPRVVGNTPLETVLLHARYSDLVIIGQDETGKDATATTRGFTEQVLLGAGKPVIVVPYAGEFETIGTRCLLAWDGSREAARAADDAMPLLAKAKLVEVVVINEGSNNPAGHGAIPGADIALYLARHGVNAQVNNIASGIDVGNTMLSHAADTGSDLIVMGAYGHSRVREWIMGGATRMLLDTMTVPVLMSH
ncbi:MAG: universal stress protein [Burkholderiaceae bacterium]